MRFPWTKRYPYDVTVRLDGRHPYIVDRVDYPSRDEVLRVHARDWNDAEREGLLAAGSLPDKWSWRVMRIERPMSASQQQKTVGETT